MTYWKEKPFEGLTRDEKKAVMETEEARLKVEGMHKSDWGDRRPGALRDLENACLNAAKVAREGVRGLPDFVDPLDNMISKARAIRALDQKHQRKTALPKVSVPNYKVIKEAVHLNDLPPTQAKESLPISQDELTGVQSILTPALGRASSVTFHKLKHVLEVLESMVNHDALNAAAASFHPYEVNLGRHQDMRCILGKVRIIMSKGNVYVSLHLSHKPDKFSIKDIRDSGFGWSAGRQCWLRSCLCPQELRQYWEVARQVIDRTTFDKDS